MTVAIQRLCGDCGTDITERGYRAIRCFRCSNRRRLTYKQGYNANRRESRATARKPRYCQDCPADISERGNSAVRCIPCSRLAEFEQQHQLREAARAAKVPIGRSPVDWDRVELHWRDGGGAKCGSQDSENVFALRLGLLTCNGCFRSLCHKPIEWFHSRESTMSL